jgi:hypothetical protein
MSIKPPDRRVFRVGHRNVVLNFRHSPDSEFGFYGHAFHDAAQTLANELLDRSGYSDLEALPIVFLYRHSVELYLKAILIIGNQLLAVNGAEFAETDIQNVLGRHRLTPFLPYLERILEATGAEWHFPDAPDLRTFEDLKKVLREVEEIDAESYAFRYPTTKKGDGSVPHNFSFDLVTCINVLDKLVESLDAALTHLDVTWDNVGDAFGYDG